MRKTHWLPVLMAGAAIFTVRAHADTPPGTTTISATSFIDFTSLSQDSNGSATNNQGYGLDVKRFYIGVDHGFDAIWSANFTTDFNYTKATGETQLFVKKAYLQAKLNDAAIFRAGSADMPWIPFDESVYGYRFVEKTLIDRLGFGNSADWGVHFLGKSDGNFANYALSAVEGGGYKNPTRSKSMDFEGRAAIMPVDGLILAVGAYTGELGQNTQTTPAINTASRQDALIAWKAARLVLGVEYFHASNFNAAAITSNKTDSASGYSLFGSYALTDEGTAVFARYDNADPSKNLDASLKDKYYNFGISFPANKNITWAIAYKHETLGDDISSNPTPGTTTTREIGVWAQVKF